MRRICKPSIVASVVRPHHNKRKYLLSMMHGSWLLIPLWIQMYSVAPSSFKTGLALVRTCFVYKLCVLITFHEGP